MTVYKLTLRDPITDRVLYTWPEDMTASEATELALHVMEDLRESREMERAWELGVALVQGRPVPAVDLRHLPYLAIRPIRVAPALVPAVPAPAAPAGSAQRPLRWVRLGLRAAFGVRARCYSLLERHVATGRVVRRVDVDGAGRPLTRRAATRQVRAEYRARPMLGHPESWTYLQIVRAGAAT